MIRPPQPPDHKYSPWFEILPYSAILGGAFRRWDYHYCWAEGPPNFQPTPKAQLARVPAWDDKTSSTVVIPVILVIIAIAIIETTDYYRPALKIMLNFVVSPSLLQDFDNQ